MKNAFGGLLFIVVALIVIVGFFFFMSGANLAAWSFFGPKVAEVQRDVTENSKSFIDSTNTAASNAIAEYYKLNTLRAASMDAGNTAMATSYEQQMMALALLVCQTVAPLGSDDYSPQVSGFVGSPTHQSAHRL